MTDERWTAIGELLVNVHTMLNVMSPSGLAELAQADIKEARGLLLILEQQRHHPGP